MSAAGQPLFATMYGWLVPRVVVPLYERLSGRAPWSEWRHLRQIQWHSPAALEASALERLRPLLSHAYEHVPFHRQRFDSRGLLPRDIASLADLARLEVTTKDDLRRDFPARVVADDLPARRGRRRVTGGSSGAPFEFIADRAQSDLRLGTYLLFREWAGLEARDARLHVASPTHFADRPSRGEIAARRALLGERLVVVSGAELTPAAFGAQVARLSRRGRWFLWTYPSYAAHLAAERLAGRLDLASDPAVVICYAETLTALDVAYIESAFGCEVRNLYSCMEVPLLAFSCPQGRSVLHVNNQRAVVRVVDDAGADVAPGERGRVVLTDLANYVMPLINYELGDVAVAGEACGCGRGFPTLTRVEGRMAEAIRTRDGRLISPSALSGVVLGVEGAASAIAQYQAEQTTADAVVLRLVPRGALPRQLVATLEKSLNDVLGAGMSSRVETVEEIPPAPSGKRLIIRSRLP